MTRILGIDPGLTRCGIGVISVDAQRKCQLVHVSVATTSPAQELSDRIGSLASAIERVIKDTNPDVISLERVFAQANLKSVMGVAQISGVVLNFAHSNQIPIQFHTPSEVKAAVTGNGRADKQQVANMVARLLGLDEAPKPADAADALAIAITAAWKGYVPVSRGALTPAQEKWKAARESAGN